MQILAIPLLLFLLLAAPADVASQTLPERAEVVRPGDVIRLRIWREAELSGDFTVDETGMVVFPKVGPLYVGEDSPVSLEDRLVDAYGAFLRHTSIEVSVMRRLQVLGAVRSPGLYPVDATMSVADVLALAGGTTPQGDPRRIELIRGDARVTGDLSADARLAGLHVRSGDQIFVPERGWLSRHMSLVAASLSAGVSLAIALLAR